MSNAFPICGSYMTDDIPLAQIGDINFGIRVKLMGC
jgi:hypothetical protein